MDEASIVDLSSIDIVFHEEKGFGPIILHGRHVEEEKIPARLAGKPDFCNVKARANNSAPV